MLGRRLLLTIGILAAIINPVLADNYNYENRPTMVQNQFKDYMVSVHEKIGKMWTPPDTLETGHAIVVFKIDRNGEIISSEIKESSGNEVFDRCALEAVNSSAPYGDFPAASGRNSITIMYNFDSSVAKTSLMKEYLKKSDELTNIDNKEALKYAELALNEIRGDSASYFIYARMSKLKRALGDIQGAQKDEAESQRLKVMFDRKRINAAKSALEEMETPFGYFTLAQAYDIAGEYSLAIASIDKAISMTKLNNSYKRYRQEIVERAKK